MKYDTVPLKSVLQPKGYIRGPFGSALKRGDMLETGVPVYEQQHAIYNSRTFRFFISPAKAIEMNRFAVEENDLIISCSGTVGMVSLIQKNDPKGIISQALLLLRVNPKIVDPVFLNYFFKSQEGYNSIISRSSGSVQVNISKRETIESIPIPLPPIDVQKKIAAILSALDEKIATNRAINDNLQQQAAALFSSLYDRSNTEVRFTDLIQILGGGTPKTGENTYWNGNIAFFTPKDVGTPYTLITEKTISKEGLSHCNSRLYPVNTVFVTARGTVGKVGMSGVPMAMNQSCYALVGKETHQLLVYFYTLKAVDRLKHKASGAVFDAITTRDFESEQIMKLSDDDATAFLRVAEPMFQEVLNNNIENLRLSTLRDSLLPKLMSGEIDVSAVQL